MDLNVNKLPVYIPKASNKRKPGDKSTAVISPKNGEVNYGFTLDKGISNSLETTRTGYTAKRIKLNNDQAPVPASNTSLNLSSLREEAKNYSGLDLLFFLAAKEELTNEIDSKVGELSSFYRPIEPGFLKSNRKAESKDEYKLKFENIKKFAEQNDPKAQYDLGLCYMKGYGTVKNPELAFENFKKSAEQNHRRAQYDLGACYMKGYGTVKNPELAFENFKKSAEQNHRRAQYDLGVCYMKGYGTVKTPELAFENFKKSAEQNDRSARDAQYALGICYRLGFGTEHNPELAFENFQKSAKKHHRDAQYMLGLYYKEGI